jgi:hypothetical protein
VIPVEGDVWEHRIGGQTNEVLLVLSYHDDHYDTRHYQLLDLLTGIIHTSILIGVSNPHDYGWWRVA